MMRTSTVLLLMNIFIETSTSIVYGGPAYSLNPVRRFRLMPRDVKHDAHQDLNKPDDESKREYRTFQVPKYEFKYSVSDPISGDYKTHRESKSGNQVKGEYSFVESDGYIRLVKYTADDEHGFVATVSRNPIIVSQAKLQGKSFTNPVTSFISSSKNEIKPELNIEIVKAKEYVPEEVEQKNAHDDTIPYVLNMRHSKPMDQIYQTDKNPTAKESVYFRNEDFNKDVRIVSSTTKYEVTEKIVPEDISLSIVQHNILRKDTGEKHRSIDDENLLETSHVTFASTGRNENIDLISKTPENQTKDIRKKIGNKEKSDITA